MKKFLRAILVMYVFMVHANDRQLENPEQNKALKKHDVKNIEKNENQEDATCPIYNGGCLL